MGRRSDLARRASARRSPPGRSFATPWLEHEHRRFFIWNVPVDLPGQPHVFIAWTEERMATAKSRLRRILRSRDRSRSAQTAERPPARRQADARSWTRTGVK